MPRTFCFRLFVLLFGVLLWASPLLAQDGYFFLRHHRHSQEYLPHHAYDLLQSETGFLYVANRRGVLRFDGKNWLHTPTPASVYALGENPETGEVWVAGKYFLGRLKKQADGREALEGIPDSLLPRQVYIQLLVTKEEVYALGEQQLIVLDAKSGEIKKNYLAPTRQEFSSAFIMDGKCYVQASETPLMQISGGKLRPAPYQLPDEDEVVHSALSPNQKELVVSTLDDRLYLFNESGFTELDVEDGLYLQRSQIIGLTFLPNRRVSVATLRGGAIVLELDGGLTKQIISTKTGLPVNEIQAITKDRSGGVWFATEYGYVRADYELPIEDFSYYEGLRGRIMDVKTFSNSLFVATSEGLFYLDEVRDYETVTYTQTRKKKTQAPVAVKQQEEAVKVPKKTGFTEEEMPFVEVAEQAEDLAGLSKRELRKRRRAKRRAERKARRNERAKENTAKEDPQDEPEEQDSKGLLGKVKDKVDDLFGGNEGKPRNANRKRKAAQQDARTETQLVKQIQRYIRLKSVSHEFRRVGDISTACTQLLEVGDQLIAVTSSGLYALKGGKNNLFFAGHAKAVYSQEAEIIYATTAANELILFTQAGGLNWAPISSYGSFGSQGIHNMTLLNNELWVCADDSIYRMNDYGDLKVKQAYAIDNPFSDEVHLLIDKGNPLFILSDKVYKLDQSRGVLVLDSAFLKKLGARPELYSREANYLWAYSNNSWKLFGQADVEGRKLALLNALDDVDHLIADKKNPGQIWAITESNHLYRFDMREEMPLNHDYGLLLTGAKDRQNNPVNLDGLVLDYDQNGVSFSFITPDYLNGEAVQYQYWLEGEMETWSAWRESGNVSFPVLNPGKYILRIRSRNTFGHIEEIKAVKFSVKPPYWKTPWFYALEMFVLAGLIIAATLVNRGRGKTQSRALNFTRRFLTIVALITSMEFFKVVLESLIDIKGSPVLDFGIEVFLALLIFPLERLMAFLILKARRQNQKTTAEEIFDAELD